MLKIKVFTLESEKFIVIKKDPNNYSAYATYYDDIMLSGYFDHKKSALAVFKILETRKKILDLGIGTGLLTEQMLQLNNQYSITGIDFSDQMLKQAEIRLKPYNNVSIIYNDVRNTTFDITFDAIISTAGPISITYRPADKQYRLFSYCVNRNEHITFIQKLSTWLNKNGLLLISIQEPHEDKDIPLMKSGLIYKQTVIFTDKNLIKTYSFWDRDQKVDEQTIKTVYFNEIEFNQIFADAGLYYEGNDASNNFCLYRRGDSNRTRGNH